MINHSGWNVRFSGFYFLDRDKRGEFKKIEQLKCLRLRFFVVCFELAFSVQHMVASDGLKTKHDLQCEVFGSHGAARGWPKCVVLIAA